MPLNLASPGIVVREVDLTIGRVDPVSASVGALVAPFAKGPVDSPATIQSEADLLNTFGQPYTTDKHYEHWMVASSYLAYGGTLLVSRADDSGLYNARVGTGSSIKIKSDEHYNQLGYDEDTITSKTFVARNPGSWANGIKVAIIDGKADQILTGIGTTAVTNTTFSTTVSAAGTVGTASTTLIVGINTTSIAVGQTLKLKTGFVGSGTTVVGISTNATYTGGAAGAIVTVSPALLNDQAFSGVTFDFGAYSTTTTFAALKVGYGVTQSVAGRVNIGTGSTAVLYGYLKGIITEVGNGQISTKVVSHVSAAGTETAVDYQQNGVFAFSQTGNVAIHTDTSATSYGTAAYTAESDWFEQQSITLSNGTIDWDTIADRPSTSAYAAARSSRFDEVHVIVIDDAGTISGNAGTILEKHLSLSKAKDAEFSVGSPSYWRKYLYNASTYLFGGSGPSGIATAGFSANGSANFELSSDSGWDQDAQGVIFGGAGSNTYTLTGGLNYNGQSGLTTSGSLSSGLDDIVSGYTLFENTENYQVDFILMGSANYPKEEAQALANKCIAVAEARKDAVAFVSPYRQAFLNDNAVGTVTVNSEDAITNNVIQFYAPITSTTYGVFDSGYKYMFDRFNNTFRYVPLNGDIAGTCARNDINQFPWFSPAGTSRGAILNAVKLAYNPGKLQRDKLYSNRINPVIFSPGAGIILFGDKTGYGKASAFDRINVRRLFIYLENAISAAAKDQLFEFNDEITRTNFVNIIEPFLRDVQSKRGIFDYVVVCDETNNTAAVIDANEFVADIYIKPARSINFIGLTFIATRTGVAFEEIIGTV